jgi:hypothetical protein
MGTEMCLVFEQDSELRWIRLGDPRSLGLACPILMQRALRDANHYPILSNTIQDMHDRLRDSRACSQGGEFESEKLELSPSIKERAYVVPAYQNEPTIGASRMHVVIPHGPASA